MSNTKHKTFQNATGKIDYTLMNDYMFRAVMQENKNVLKQFICALLHLDPPNVKSVDILNPIELGKSYDDKTFVLDIKVMLNNAAIINLEMQVLQQSFWSDRSLSYLCDIYNNLKKGDDYLQIKPAYHISIVDFTPFPAYPEFYAANKMVNIKKHYIYNDNFTLNVLDLNQINLATAEDKAYKIDYWAKLFKAKTWEDLKMLAQKDDIFEETSEAIYNLNQDDTARYWCEAREEGHRILRTYESLLKRSDTKLAEKDAIIAEKDSTIAEKDSTIADMNSTIAMLEQKLKAYET